MVADWGAEKSPELIEEMIITALKMARDKMGTGDLKLMNRSLKELRYAAKIFAPYRDRRKVVVFGSARTASTEPEARLAEEFCRQMVAHHYMVITGGGDGIMGAAQRGAGRENSFGLNIRLPFEQRANEIIEGDPKLINFNYFFTRKLNFVKETHAFALFPGGFGTMDEGFEALTLMQTGKALIIPIVLIDRPEGSYWETWMRFLTDHLLKQGLISEEDFNLIKIAHRVEDAVAEILQFYKNYVSSRWVGSQLVFRISKPLTQKALDDLNQQFANIAPEGCDRAGRRFASGAESTRDRAFAAVDSNPAPPRLWTLSAVDRRDQPRGDLVDASLCEARPCARPLPRTRRTRDFQPGSFVCERRFVPRFAERSVYIRLPVALFFPRCNRGSN